MILHIFLPFPVCCSSELNWQCLVPANGPPATTWVVTACPTDQISRDNPRRLLVTTHIVPSPHWSTALLTFCLKFTHSVTNNFPASKLLGRQKNDSYWAPYGWSHKAHCVLISPSLVNASHCVVSDAAIRMGSIVPLSLNIRLPFHESCFHIHQWSSQRSEYGIIGNQGCISCGILLSGTGARGVSSEHMENMEMFSCSPT